MASSDFLRENINQHSIKNSLSKTMDSDIATSIATVITRLQEKYPQLTFRHQKTLTLREIIIIISKNYPEYASELAETFDSSFISPDGGFLFASDADGVERIVLVSEVKRQGTNDKRKLEGLAPQARGNAIERLGKNLIGIRAIFKKEAVLPFVCFGQGDDFSRESSIIDRVITMNEFFPLNKIFVEKKYPPFEPVSMFFRPEAWSTEEMTETMFLIATKSIDSQFS